MRTFILTEFLSHHIKHMKKVIIAIGFIGLACTTLGNYPLAVKKASDLYLFFFHIIYIIFVVTLLKKIFSSTLRINMLIIAGIIIGVLIKALLDFRQASMMAYFSLNNLLPFLCINLMLVNLEIFYLRNKK